MNAITDIVKVIIFLVFVLGIITGVIGMILWDDAYHWLNGLTY